MRIILGIGNTGNRYLYTRHNAGFLFLDYFAGKKNLSFKASKHEYYYSQGKTGESGFFLIKPTTYVNNSGIAALHAADEFGVAVEDILVVADDINLPLTEIRIRASGGDGGHNGLKSLIYHLNSNQFPRIRLGIGSSFKEGDKAEYVLSPFNPDELGLIKETFEKGVIIADEFIKGGLKGMLDANAIMIKPPKPEGI